MTTSNNKNFEKANKLLEEIGDLFSKNEIKSANGLKIYKKFLELKLELFNLAKDFNWYRSLYLGIEQKKRLRDQRRENLLKFLSQRKSAGLKEILNNSIYTSERTLRRDLGYLLRSGKIKASKEGKKKIYYAP